MVIKQDGANKNDCERNASRRFYEDFRREHPHLKVIVVEDGLASNDPHIRDIIRLGLRFILGAKPGDHTFFFAQIDAAVEDNRINELQYQDPDDQDRIHHFRYLNQLAARARWRIKNATFNTLKNQGYYRVDSMETILRAIAHGFERRELKEVYQT